MAIITGFSALVAVDFIGNTLVILVVLKNKTNTPMNYLLLNLALADLLLAIFIGPRFIFSHLFNHPTGITGDMIVWLFIVVVRCLLLLVVSYYGLYMSLIVHLSYELVGARLVSC